MPKGDSYKELHQYLMRSKVSSLNLTFDKIEEILNRKLPKSAYKYKEWWANDITHSQAIAWIEAGYKTINISQNFAQRKITFSKV